MQKYILSLIAFSFFSFTVSQSPVLTSKVRKKIHKTITNLWNSDEVAMVEVPYSKKMESEKFFREHSVFEIKEGNETKGYMCLRRIHGCKLGGCEAGGNTDNPIFDPNYEEDAFETFDYILLVNRDMEVIHVEVVDYPGEYGYEVSSKNWLKQFIGYKGENWAYGKDIDGISGATISANSITYDIQDTQAALVSMLDTISVATF